MVEGRVEVRVEVRVEERVEEGGGKDTVEGKGKEDERER